MTDPAPEVIRNEAERRWEMKVEGELAVLTYRRSGNTVVTLHTGVPPALEGRGLGTRLVREALSQIRAEGLKVRAVCPFVKRYLDRTPADQDLLSA